MNIEQQNRILELAMKWQDPAYWNIMFQCERDWRHHREQASIDRQMSRDPSVHSELFLNAARMHQETAEQDRNDVLVLRGELLELQNLVRLHAPQLLEFTVTCADVSGNDYAPLTLTMKRLEGAVRAMEDDWSTGRSKADWLALKHMTKDQWDAMRESNKATRIQNVPGNQRLWQFRKSLCEERGFSCPEFAEK